MPKNRNVLMFLFLILLGTTAAFGQVGTASSLTGTVTTEGAPLPGVTVTVSSPGLQGTRTTVSGEGGGYNFPSLPVGAYTVTFELSGLQKVTRQTTLQLATGGRVDVDMKVSAVSEAITVTASAPAVLETTEVARNFTSEQVSLLPVRRNITDTVVLAPGVNTNGARGNITISGAGSFDNLFMVNGVVVNENLRGQPHNLFIEDAIQESTIITGSVSAEYGRFTGGVVSTITKSGGNEFTGSFRDNLTNGDWVAKTPIEKADHVDKVSHVYEGTLGGYAWKDRLWFFGAGRKASGAPADGKNASKSTSVLLIPYQNTIDEDRYEVKLTAQVLPQHSVIASFLDVDTVETNNAFVPIYDDLSIVPTRSLPNDLLALSYNGVITSSLLLEGQYSEKNFAFVNSGGRFTDQIGGTWLADTRARWNAPVFCGVCTAEERNNDSKLLKTTYFVNTRNWGTHTLVAGGEDYHETRLANNYQSASQFQIVTTGTATILPGDTNIYPRLDRNSAIQYRPILELSQGSNLTTKAFFANDKWDFNKHWNFNLGIRFDKNDAIDASGNTVSDDSAFSPRLGVVFDVRGDGRFRVNASYSHYVAKIVDGNVGGFAAGAGAPALFQYRYETDPAIAASLGVPVAPSINPAGTPQNQLIPTQAALQILFNWYNSLSEAQKNALLTAVSYPGFSAAVLEPISSPYVQEIVLGFGSQFSRRGYVRVDFINREWNDFFQSRTDLSTGTFTTPAGQKGDLNTIVNDDGFIERKYRGIQTQFNWAANRWNVGGGYTWATLKGNDSPEGDGTAAVRNAFGYVYPEYLNYENRNPKGYLFGDQRHRARVWAGYDVPFPMGKLNATVIQSYDSGRAFSAVGSVNAGASSPGAPANPGYLLTGLGTVHDYYFSERGAFRTEEAHATDLALNYSLPIRMVELFVQGQVLNVFNNDAVNNIWLGNMNFTVETNRSGGAGLVAFDPRTTTPVEGTHYRLGPSFGKENNQDAFQQARTYRFGVGLRF
ncbi:MAG TPA: TonB-dependent receptor [Thermoanaerobaculia bacterium]|nr:TonB-dependent receptor [Thermoanaerobaculia bacterium]